MIIQIMSVNERKILNLRRLKIEKDFQYFSKTINRPGKNVSFTEFR
jgi:hypothetical protein